MEKVHFVGFQLPAGTGAPEALGPFNGERAEGRNGPISAFPRGPHSKQSPHKGGVIRVGR